MVILRHFLLDFDHTTLVFGEILAKRNRQIVEEAQRCALILLETIQKIATGTCPVCQQEWEYEESRASKRRERG